MARTGLFTHDHMLRHESGGWHPECPDRLHAARAGVAPFVDELIRIDAQMASEDDLALIHTPQHIDFVRRKSRGEAQLDPDTYVNEHSWEAARLAAGGAIAIVDALVEGTIERALALVRPPGHHATPSRAMGFCLFNNIAIAARHARARRGVERILIVDWDAHHGNGTQEAFWTDGTVGYFSVHQFPYYPGTGSAGEIGAGDGEGATVNVPLPAGAGDESFLGGLEQLWPLWDRIEPELVLVSAGFDGHARDRLVQLEVTTAGFRRVIEAVIDRAGSVPVAHFMEGGYDELALREGWAAIAETCTL